MNQRQRFSPASGSGLAEAPRDGVWNELLDGQGRVRPYWAEMHARIQGWTADERKILLDETARMLEDLGTTFNVFRDVGGAGQPYEIDPIPFIMEWQEWEIVEKGLAQRMRLLEAVLSDLYGPRLLLKDGLVPPDLVHASPAFHHSTRDIHPSGKRWLLASGCDLVRGAERRLDCSARSHPHAWRSGADPGEPQRCLGGAARSFRTLPGSEAEAIFRRGA